MAIVRHGRAILGWKERLRIHMRDEESKRILIVEGHPEFENVSRCFPRATVSRGSHARTFLKRSDLIHKRRDTEP